jgi:hypothetical protein
MLQSAFEEAPLARGKIVDANDQVTIQQQAINQRTSNKARTTRNDKLHAISSVIKLDHHDAPKTPPAFGLPSTGHAEGVASLLLVNHRDFERLDACSGSSSPLASNPDLLRVQRHTQCSIICVHFKFCGNRRPGRNDFGASARRCLIPWIECSHYGLSFGGGVAALLAQVGCELSPQPTIARNEDRVASSEPDEILFSYSLP